jgi:hypothetical protein
MDNPETQATLGTQDTGQRQTKQQTQHRKLKGTIKNGQSRDTGNIGNKIQKTNKNKTEQTKEMSTNPRVNPRCSVCLSNNLFFIKHPPCY